jgi:drug/metabolite transporter superfamily protein YnfA
MRTMHSRSSLPDLNRIGVLTAAVLLAFALTRLLPTSQVVLRLTLGNFFLTYPISLTTVMTLLAAGVTATGMDWLLRGHPALGSRRTVEHWLLPTLTTFVIGVPLSLLPGGASWWVTFAIAGLALVTVFIAEYVAVDPTAPAYSAATGLLTALSFAVYLILLTTMHSSSPRLVIAVPAVFIVSGLVSLRALRLRSQEWEYIWAGGIALISAQLASALHYWPLSPIQFGLALLGPLYALTSLAGSLGEDAPVRRAAIGPLAALTLAWVAAAFLG